MNVLLAEYQWDAITAVGTCLGTLAAVFMGWLAWKATSAKRDIAARRKRDEEEKALIEKGKRLKEQEIEAAKELAERQEVTEDIGTIKKQLKQQTEDIVDEVSKRMAIAMAASRNGEYKALTDSVARVDTAVAELKQAFDDHVVEDRESFTKLLAK